jgi:hypothetical protein
MKDVMAKAANRIYRIHCTQQFIFWSLDRYSIYIRNSIDHWEIVGLWHGPLREAHLIMQSTCAAGTPYFSVQSQLHDNTAQSEFTSG